MQIYVAGRTKNITEVRAIQEVVMEQGHEITHDWTGDEGEVRDSWADDPVKARHVAAADLLGTANAHGIILCGYGCAEGEGGLGIFIEAGIAIMSEVSMIVLGPMRESVFWYAPFTLRVNYREADKQNQEAMQKEHGFIIKPSDSDIIELETMIALKGLESMNRQKRLALSPTDTTLRMP